MNPPSRFVYKLTILVNEACTQGEIISREKVLDKTSSISSGALADHSSLSESERTSRSEELSVSTSSSSGLSVTQSLLKGGASNTKTPCFGRVKITCDCGQPTCDSTPVARLTNGDVPAAEAEVDHSAHVHMETEFHSDMDLTNPLGRSSMADQDTGSKEPLASVENPPVLDPQIGAAVTQQEQSFPRIKLSLRPSCQLIQDPGPSEGTDPHLSGNLGSDDEDNDSDNPSPTLWRWTKNILKMFCAPDQLPLNERPPEVPTHWVEDENSLLFHMCWMILTQSAKDRYEPPPNLTVRIFHDPCVEEYPHPTDYTDNLAHLKQSEISVLLEDYYRAREAGFSRFPFMRPTTQLRIDNVPACAASPDKDYVVCDDDDEYFVEELETHTRPSSTEISVNGSEAFAESELQMVPPAVQQLLEQLRASPVERSYSPFLSRQRRQEDMDSDSSDFPGFRTPSPPPKRSRRKSSPPVSTQNVSTVPTLDVIVKSDQTLLVYARCDRWYYPGLIYSTIEEWDSSVEPLKVFYCDGQQSNLPPDQIFPMDRLPPGAIIQRQTDVSIYEDVNFLSCASKTADSAKLIVQDPDDNTSVEVAFSTTALSPKDVIRLRSALKSQFYPSKIRQNFTEVSQGAILQSASRRSRVRNLEPENVSRSLVKSQGNDQASKKRSHSGMLKSSADRPQPVENKAIDELKASQTAQPSGQAAVELEFQKSTKFRCGTCMQLFASTKSVKDHQRRSHKNRRINTMTQVYQCQFADCSVVTGTRDQFRRHLNSHNIPTAAQPKQASVNGAIVTKSTPHVFAQPSTSGLTPAPRKSAKVKSDSDTDTSLARNWTQPVSIGLQHELVVLGNTAKSFTSLKDSSKNQGKTNLFVKTHFVLTKGMESCIESPSKTKRQKHSESESTDNENYYYTPIKFEAAALQRVIEVGGGRLYANLASVPSDVIQSDPSSVVVVSNHPCTTPNYILGVALGVTLLRHDTILECARKNVDLRSVLSAGSAMYLSPGWDLERHRWVPPRTSKKSPLNRRTVLSVLHENTSYWHQIIRQLGGKGVEWLNFRLSLQPDILMVVTDHPLPQAKYYEAIERGLPVVSTKWLIQAVITGGKPPFDNYKVTGSSPSSPEDHWR